MEIDESMRQTFRGSESINKEKPVMKQISRVDHDDISIGSDNLSEVD